MDWSSPAWHQVVYGDSNLFVDIVCPLQSSDGDSATTTSHSNGDSEASEFETVREDKETGQAQQQQSSPSSSLRPPLNHRLRPAPELFTLWPQQQTRAIRGWRAKFEPHHEELSDFEFDTIVDAAGKSSSCLGTYSAPSPLSPSPGPLVCLDGGPEASRH